MESRHLKPDVPCMTRQHEKQLKNVFIGTDNVLNNNNSCASGARPAIVQL